MSYIVVTIIKAPQGMGPNLPAIMVHTAKTEAGAKRMTEVFKQAFAHTETKFEIINDGEEQ